MAEKNTYRLINPYIEGSLDTTVRAGSSFRAGKKLYNLISNFFTNHVNDFYMTVQNTNTKDLSHFRINETREDGGAVNFNLVKLEEKFDPSVEKKLINNVAKLGNQSGGRHHKRRYENSPSESSSSSDDSEFFKYPVQPISRFVYFYLPYYRLNLVGLSPLDTARIFMPMFSLPINPSLEIRFDLYRYFI